MKNGIIRLTLIWVFIVLPINSIAQNNSSSAEEIPQAVDSAKKNEKIAPPKVEEAPYYQIGPKDSISIFVWGHPDLSTSAAVRPDGRITIPLVEDLPVTGRTPTELAREIEKHLSTYVRDPLVVVMVSGVLGPFDRQIRILGEAAQPQALPYIEGMTLLDLMIQVGGITDFAAGNKAKIIRTTKNGQIEFRARLDDLIRDGDFSANMDLLPGDILIIPESWF